MVRVPPEEGDAASHGATGASVTRLPHPVPPRRLSCACIARVPGGATPTVSVVFDLAGEVAACVADVALLERELAQALLRTAGVADALSAAPVLMLDGNLSEAALQVGRAALAANHEAGVAVPAVCAAGVVRTLRTCQKTRVARQGWGARLHIGCAQPAACTHLRSPPVAITSAHLM